MEFLVIYDKLKLPNNYRKLPTNYCLLRNKIRECLKILEFNFELFMVNFINYMKNYRKLLQIFKDSKTEFFGNLR